MCQLLEICSCVSSRGDKFVFWAEEFQKFHLGSRFSKIHVSSEEDLELKKFMLILRKGIKASFKF